MSICDSTGADLFGCRGGAIEEEDDDCVRGGVADGMRLLSHG